MTKKLNNPLAKFTVDRGYLCRVDERGMLNYDYPEGEMLYVKHPKVYQQLIGLKKDNNLTHTIVPTFPTMEMMPHDKIKWNRILFQNLTTELVNKVKVYCHDNFQQGKYCFGGNGVDYLMLEFLTLDAEVVIDYWGQLEELINVES